MYSLHPEGLRLRLQHSGVIAPSPGFTVLQNIMTTVQKSKKNKQTLRCIFYEKKKTCLNVPFTLCRVSLTFLLFSLCSPYVEPAVTPPSDDIDPAHGLHDYQLYIVLHDTVSELMSGCFSQLFCRRGTLFIFIF